MHFQLPDDDVTTDYETLDRELQQKIEADGYTLVPTVPHSNHCCTSHIPITVSATLLPLYQPHCYTHIPTTAHFLSLHILN